MGRGLWGGPSTPRPPPNPALTVGAGGKLALVSHGDLPAHARGPAVHVSEDKSEEVRGGHIQPCHDPGLDGCHLRIAPPAEALELQGVKAEAHGVALGRRRLLQLQAQVVQVGEVVAPSRLAAGGALGVGAAQAGASPQLTALAQGTAHVAPAATTAKVVSLVQPEEALLAGRAGLAAHMGLAEALAVARLALSSSAQGAPGVTAAAGAALGVAGTQPPEAGFAAIAARPFHVSPAQTGGLRKDAIGRDQAGGVAGASFAVGEVVGAGLTRVTPQPRHSGAAAALTAPGVAG